MQLQQIRNKGFSLVELLIVITIIGVMSAIGLSFAAILQKNTRDAQRQSDLSALQSAIQQFYADQNHFPNTLVITAGAALTNCTGESGCSITKTYLSKTPIDPTSGTTDPYCYTSQTSAVSALTCSAGNSNLGACHYYELCAKLENPSGAAASCVCDNGNNFKVTPL